jgi:hypothetical protein
MDSGGIQIGNRDIKKDYEHTEVKFEELQLGNKRAYSLRRAGERLRLMKSMGR